MVFNEHECGFCKSEVSSDATVCAHCGAIKGFVYDAWKGGLDRLFLPFLFLIVFVSIAIFPKTEGYLFGGAIIFIAFGCMLKLGLKRTWLRRN